MMMPAGKGNQNALRPGNTEPSTSKVMVGCTPAELESYHALARGQKMRLAELVRKLLAEEQARVDALSKSKRPPRR
jgi:hypothetical protein